MQRRSIIPALVAVALPSAVLAGQGAKCAPDNAGLKLPSGFCAMVYADTIRGARDLIVAPNGDVFVSSQGRGTGGVIALRDGAARPFATGFSSSDVALFDGYLYAEAAPAGGQGGG